MARGKYKGPKRGAGQRQKASGGASGEEEERRPGFSIDDDSNVVSRRAPVSESDSEDDAPAAPKVGKGGALNIFGALGAPGDLPPNSSDEDDSESDGEIAPHGPPVPEPPRRRAKDEEDDDPEKIARDLARLEMIRGKREQERLDRIKKEGWDRFAPLSETNKPPGGKPPAPVSSDEEDDSD